MTVLMLVIDGLGNRSASPTLMPTLTSWGERGLRRSGGATSVLTSATYPNFAAIVTGSRPADHGLFANEVWTEGELRAAGEVGPRSRTFLDADAEVVVGDHNLIGVIGAREASRHWPPEGRIPSGAPLDIFGYIGDEMTVDRLIDALQRRPALLFAQLNSPDTYAHWYGPDSEEAFETYAAVDLYLAAMAGMLDPERDVVLVTSDHDQETVDPGRRIDLAGIGAGRDDRIRVVHEGTAAVITGPVESDLAWLDGIDGVQGWGEEAPGTWLVFSDPGWWFADAEFPEFNGAHGGRRTRETIAVALGPERAIDALRPKFLGPRLGAEDWFQLVAIARALD